MGRGGSVERLRDANGGIKYAMDDDG